MATKPTPPKPAAEEPLLDELEKATRKLLREVMKDPEASLTDKTKVMDRALKLAAIKAKLQEDDWGKGFQDDPDA